MDSLLANYASSDEEGNDEQPPPQQRIPPARTVNSKSEDSPPKPTSKHGGIFNSLPPPKSSLFNSLPPPKPQAGYAQKRDVDARDERIPKPSSSSSSSSLFTSLPQPKLSSSSSASKKVVQFRPPTMTNPYNGNLDDEDDDVDEGELERHRKRSKESISTSSAASFLSSIPAPRYSNTLGTMGSASGMNRRSIIETDAPYSAADKVGTAGNDAVVNPNAGYLKDQLNETNYDYSANESSRKYYSGNFAVTNSNVGGTSSSVELGSDAGVNYDASHFGNQAHDVYDHSGNFGGESYYGDIAQYDNNWANATAFPEVSAVAEEALRVPGRRGRKDTPLQIVEVKQDELMKNRPRQDQVKSTGIAFGPQYQPASTKGKPTKLHKRKHQIGSLLFDMRQKEMELAERRSKGFLTKAQTQAKYGW